MNMFFTLCSILFGSDGVWRGNACPHGELDRNNNSGQLVLFQVSFSKQQVYMESGDVVMSTPLHVSWMCSHSGKPHSNELTLPDKSIEALIYLYREPEGTDQHVCLM